MDVVEQILELLQVSVILELYSQLAINYLV